MGLCKASPLRPPGASPGKSGGAVVLSQRQVPGVPRRPRWRQVRFCLETRLKVKFAVFSDNRLIRLCVCVCFYLSVAVWNIEKKQAICGNPASAHSAGNCFSIQYSNTDDNKFITGGKWALDSQLSLNNSSLSSILTTIIIIIIQILEMCCIVWLV